MNKLLVGNKSDLIVKRAVSYEQAKEFADSIGIEFVETSAKSSTNVEKAFIMMAQQIKSNMKSAAPAAGNKKGGVSLQGKDINGKDSKKSSGCC